MCTTRHVAPKQLAQRYIYTVSPFPEPIYNDGVMNAEVVNGSAVHAPGFP